MFSAQEKPQHILVYYCLRLNSSCKYAASKILMGNRFCTVRGSTTHVLGFVFSALYATGGRRRHGIQLVVTAVSSCKALTIFEEPLGLRGKSSLANEKSSPPRCGVNQTIYHLCPSVALYVYRYGGLSHLYFPASGQAVVSGNVPSPSRYVPSVFITHWVQPSHWSSILIECC